MYNEDLKSKYIKEKVAMDLRLIKSCELLFGLTEKFENEWGVDIYSADTNKVKELADNELIHHASGRRKDESLEVIKDYVKWCVSQGIENVNTDILNIEGVNYDKVRRQMVSSPGDLQDVFNKVFDPEVLGTVDNLYRCYLWLAFMGVKREEVYDVKIDDVDLRNMIVKYRDTSLTIYPEAALAFSNVVNLDSFVYIHPLYSETKRKYRVEGDYLLRGLGEIKSQNALTTVCARKFSNSNNQENGTDRKLNYAKLETCGIFYRMYELEKMGMPISFKAIVANDLAYEGINPLEGRGAINVRDKNRFLKREYARWKSAFKL